MKNSKSLPIVFGTLLMTIFTLAFSSSASAHGYVSKPESRGFLCKTGANINCGSIQYEPQSLEALGNFPIGGPADGRIASANKFIELDEQSTSRWTKVPMKSGSNTFEWTLTAIHATAKWDYYITKKDWNPDQPLKRADLKLFCTIENGGKRPAASVKHTCDVPERSGYQVIIAVWSIGDTKNAFYNVIDANFDGTAVPPTNPGPVKPNPTTGTWNSTQAYVAGKEVTHNGSTYKAKWWTKGDKPGDSAVWELVNNDDVTPPPSSSNEWDQNSIYLVGDTALSKGLLYKAKWWTRGEKPEDSAVWQLVKTNSSTDPLASEWSSSKGYVSGDLVKYKDNLYKANWWTQGNTPSSSREWSVVK